MAAGGIVTVLAWALIPATIYAVWKAFCKDPRSTLGAMVTTILGFGVFAVVAGGLPTQGSALIEKTKEFLTFVFYPLLCSVLAAGSLAIATREKRTIMHGKRGQDE